jgi:hypothetical protein
MRPQNSHRVMSLAEDISHHICRCIAPMRLSKSHAVCAVDRSGVLPLSIENRTRFRHISWTTSSTVCTAQVRPICSSTSSLCSISSKRKNLSHKFQTATGPKRKAIYGKDREDVAAKLADALSNRNKGLVFDAGSLKVGEYLDLWLSDFVRGTVRTSTFERHEQIIRAHLAPAFGRMKLKNLTPAHMRSLHREKLEEGLVPRLRVRKIHSTLHKALSQAVADGLIPRNTADVKTPRPAPAEMRPLSEAEARMFLGTARETGDRFEALYVLAITTGLRRGELLGAPLGRRRPASGHAAGGARTRTRRRPAPGWRDQN